MASIRISLAFLLLLASLGSVASAAILDPSLRTSLPSDDGWYVEVAGGLQKVPDLNSTLQTESSGYQLGAIVGYKSESWRYEGQLNYLTTDYKNFATGDIEATVFLFNFIYDIESWLSEDFTPYWGLGIGYGELKGRFQVGPMVFGRNQDSVAVQGLLGLGYHLSDSIVARVGYRYLRGVDAEDITGNLFQAHIMDVGLRFKIAI